MPQKRKADFCYHDYKNALPIGKVDHMCPKCFKMLDPGEWFLMNSFEFVDVTHKNVKKELIKMDKETSKKAKLKYKFKNKDAKLLK
jgi:hypothetical protein